METITQFFTDTPSLNDMYYVIIGLSLLGIILFHFLPEKTALQIFVPYQLISHRAFLHKKERKAYDWSTALRRQKILFFIGIVFSLLILFVSNRYGDLLAKIGLGLLAFLFIAGGFWIDLTKKSI